MIKRKHSANSYLPILRGLSFISPRCNSLKFWKLIAKTPTASVFGLYSQSGYQWHTAAILLAVGLGLTSCLFGLLVGRCRQRGRFDQGGPRSKAAATSHLRQRILRTRGLSNNDLERSGLLSKLQLWQAMISAQQSHLPHIPQSICVVLSFLSFFSKLPPPYPCAMFLRPLVPM